MTKIIAPAYLHDLLSQQLVAEKKVVFDTALLPLQAFLSDFSVDSAVDYDKELKIRLKSLHDQVRVLGSYLENPTFIQSIKDFHIDIYLYGININDLAKTSRKDQDLKLIFSFIQDLVPNEIETYNNLKQYLLNNDLLDVYYLDHDYSTNIDLETIKLLKAHGLKEYPKATYAFKSMTINYANNIRSEIEASAQFIIKNKLDKAQVIYLNDNYLPIIKQIYGRYNIASNLDDYLSPAYNKRFLSLVKLLIRGQADDLSNFLSANILGLEKLIYLEKLNDFFKFDLDSLLSFENQPLNDSILNKYDIKYYNELLEKSSENINIIKALVLELKPESHNQIQIIENVFNYLLNNYYDPSLNKLSSILLQNQSQLLETEDIILVLEDILSNNLIKSYQASGIFVTSLNEHLHFDKENVILLGATSKNYPNLKALSGVIDEEYVKNLNYPKKSLRFDRQLKTYDKLLEANNLHVFYPLATNEGKNIEPSFALLNYGKKHQVQASPYPLIENDFFQKKLRSLDPSLAKDLFFDGHKLHGSISSFEAYNSCPYGYYLRNGLKIYERSLPELSPAYIGSLLHELIEKIVSKAIVSNENISSSDLVDLIENSFHALSILDDPRVEIVKKTLVKHFLRTLERIKRMDLETSFKPIEVENDFSYNINDNIRISGKIDRIDQFENYIRVIDYKSSNQTMSEPSFKTGQQLQLMTYLLAASEARDLVPAGAYYISLHDNFKLVEPRKVTKTKPFLHKFTEADYVKEVEIANRQHGWHFVASDEMYSSVTHSVNLKEKDGIVSIGKTLNFETIVTILKDLYQDVYEHLESGIIEFKPGKVHNPYCEFTALCQNNQAQYEREFKYADQKLSEEIE